METKEYVVVMFEIRKSHKAASHLARKGVERHERNKESKFDPPMEVDATIVRHLLCCEVVCLDFRPKIDQ